MIDWHSHILPGVDDGSKNEAETSALLGMLYEQGVRTVIATPHYFADDESVESFLSRRHSALELANACTQENAPLIIPGAEVRYYRGISRLEELRALRVGASKLLLLEMPQEPFTEYTIRELLEISGMPGIIPVLAHVERYPVLQKERTMERLCEGGVLMQSNAENFFGFFSRRKALSMLCAGEIHFIGSDCHNLNTRAPRIKTAYDIIKHKLGKDFVTQMNDFGYSMLSGDGD